MLVDVAVPPATEVGRPEEDRGPAADVHPVDHRRTGVTPFALLLVLHLTDAVVGRVEGVVVRQGEDLPAREGRLHQGAEGGVKLFRPAAGISNQIAPVQHVAPDAGYRFRREADRLMASEVHDRHLRRVVGELVQFQLHGAVADAELGVGPVEEVGDVGGVGGPVAEEVSPAAAGDPPGRGVGHLAHQGRWCGLAFLLAAPQWGGGQRQRRKRLPRGASLGLGPRRGTAGTLTQNLAPRNDQAQRGYRQNDHPSHTPSTHPGRGPHDGHPPQDRFPPRPDRRPAGRPPAPAGTAPYLFKPASRTAGRRSNQKFSTFWTRASREKDSSRLR